ncbi:hypothetical protein D9619_006251 [Psilocybe cf. subviscida]|uniref:C2H2-type domain-containing protein n=1 Tax=Psilocybe cf. subviscida TaxID=2480587 RepID=A0A8H5B471_9AGAR|nr:hypothetical protein D9619_006251 [Psilocybe cf. subviscida]
MNTSQHTPASKRPRAPSSPRVNSIGYASPDPPSKASRIHPQSLVGSDPAAPDTSAHASGTTAGSAVPLICNLPPTCHHRPTAIANSTDLERHYATYHAHVCGEKGCACVFPEARLLELHQTECHDPIAALNKERGKKIFQCHLPAPTCGRYFMTPKARRLHLIQAHAYPKQYFFAVTNKGIGQLLKKWGEGASMVRKEWKPRESQAAEETMAYRDDEDKMDEDDDVGGDHDSDDDDDDDDDEIASQEAELEEDEEMPKDEEDVEATPRMLPRTTGIGIHSPQSSISDASSLPPASRRGTKARVGAPSQSQNNNSGAGVDSLVNSLESLTLIPNSVRFGRGGKASGFAPNPRGRGRGRARGGIVPPPPTRGRGGTPAPVPMSVDVRPPAPAGDQDAGGPPRVGGIIQVSPDVIPRGRGRGGIGRARAARSRGRGRGT